MGAPCERCPKHGKSACERDSGTRLGVFPCGVLVVHRHDIGNHVLHFFHVTPISHADFGHSSCERLEPPPYPAHHATVQCRSRQLACCTLPRNSRVGADPPELGAIGRSGDCTAPSVKSTEHIWNVCELQQFPCATVGPESAVHVDSAPGPSVTMHLACHSFIRVDECGLHDSWRDTNTASRDSLAFVPRATGTAL